MTTATMADFRTLIQVIPGYDPVATAGLADNTWNDVCDPDVGDYWFDADAAQLALDFFPDMLKHVKGALAKEPFEPMPWQQSIVANLFGWKRRGADGMRRFREVFIYVPRKNGKTTLAAGIVNYVMFCDGEPGAEIYSAAADRDQAALVFAQVTGMIRQEPELNSRCTIYGGGPGGQSRTIALADYSGSYKVLSADAHTKHGFNSHLVVNDELHAHRTRDLVDVLETSMGSRRQPILLHITTADFARESICNEKHDYAIKVRDGIIDNPAFLPVIYEAARDDDWTDPAVWARVNPCLGVSLYKDYLEAQCQKAQDSPAYENTFKRLHLNMQTEQATRWLAMHVWDANSDGVDATDWKAAMAWRERMLAELAGKPCWAGLDLANTTDIAALVLMFPVDAEFVVLPWFWVPKVGAERRERVDRVPYLTWARQGFITLTEGNSIDYRDIRATINTIGKDYGLQDIGFDPFNATHLATELIEEDGFAMVQFRQGAYSYNEPMKAFEGLLLDGHIRHGANPVLSWMASNIAVKTDAQANIYPAKDKSAEKIDGICAAVMGLARAMFGSEQSGSVYEGRGVLTL